MYSCGSSQCFGKKLSLNKLKTDDIFIPLRLMQCAHSVCELCVLHFCQNNLSFIKCSICGFNNTITESVSRNVTQFETEIKKWLDSSGSVGQVLSLDMNLFPLDLYSIALGIDSGLLTATKTVETIELDLEDDCLPQNELSSLNNYNNNNNSLAEDDMTVTSIVSKVPKTASKRFVEMVNNGVKTFTDLSRNHTSLKRTSDETKEWFKKLKTNTKEVFHRLHSILQLREKELLDEIDSNEEIRLQDLRVFMNEILSKRSELKGKLLHCSQLQSDKDKNVLKKAVEQLVKDSNVLHLNSPQNEYKLLFDSQIESQLKAYGSIERNFNSVHEEVKDKADEEMEVITDLDKELAISVSSDDEEVSCVAVEDEPRHQLMNREVVFVLQSKSPLSFYVQKERDKELFENLSSQITQICSSPYYHSPAIETLANGEKIFAYSSKLKCWCRATLIVYREVENQENDFIADVFLIDYGLTETVNWFNIREKKRELFDDRKWPPFAYKCALYNIKPNKRVGTSGFGDWFSGEALELFDRYVSNNQLVMFVYENRDAVNFVDLIHYEVPEVTTYQIPSLIEIFVNYEYALLTDDIDFHSSNRYKCHQQIKYKEREMPKQLKTVSVLVSHVESPDLFYVQLQRKHNDLLKLIDELNETYNSKNASTYTYYCPKVNTPCAALFDGDNRFYRALVVQKGKTPTDSVVQFVDFGNKQMVRNCNLRLLKDSIIQKLEIQSIPCKLIHVDPGYGFKWSENATDYFKFAISNDRGPQILTMCVYEVDKQKKLEVVLRSYDGDNGVKINEVLVQKKLAVSTGPLSMPDDYEGMMSSQESLNSLGSTANNWSKDPNPVTLPFKVSAFIVMKEMFERSKLAKADKRSSLIKVSISFAKNPSQFYVQIDKQEIKSYFQDMEKLLHEEYSSLRYRHLGDTNFIDEDLCAFKIDNHWRRGRVIHKLINIDSTGAPEEPKFKVFDIDYGMEHNLKVSQMRRLCEQFTKDGSFAVQCRLTGVRPTGGSDWTHSARDELRHNIEKYAKNLYVLVKEHEIAKEPVSLLLYGKETTIPGAFDKEKTIYHNFGKTLVSKGLATFERNDSSVSGSDCEADDDNEINEETPRESRTIPFSLLSQTNGDVSILEKLHQRRIGNDMSAQSVKFFKYLDEVYPMLEREFYGTPSDVDTKDDFTISFRHWKDGSDWQPLQIIDKSIEETIHSKGELEPFTGPFTKDNACTAYFEYDSSWNRAEIVGISKKSDEIYSQLIVRFVDYGNTESILVDKLSSDLFGRETPKLALKCKLYDLNPVNNEAVAAIRNEIYTNVIDKKCKFYWENFPELPMIASLEIPNFENQYQSLRTILQNNNLIKNDEMDVYSNPNEVEEIMSILTFVRQTYGLYPVQFDTSKFYKVVLSYNCVENYAFFQAIEIRQPLNEEVMVNDEHDSFIWMLESMRNNVQQFKILKNLREGTPCCAQFSDDFWYRGLVTNVDFGTKTAQIFFIDYGNTDSVSFNKIRELPSEHMKPSAHAFFCQIYNIKPRKNHLWSKRSDLTEKMFEHLSVMSAEEKLFAKFKNCNSPPFLIDLYIADENDGTKVDKHAFQAFVNEGLYEFVNQNDVWRKPIQTNQSLRSQYIKTERMD